MKAWISIECFEYAIRNRHRGEADHALRIDLPVLVRPIGGLLRFGGTMFAMNLTDEQYELLKAMVEAYRSGNTTLVSFATTLEGSSLSYSGLLKPVNADRTDLYQLEQLDLVTLDRNDCNGPRFLDTKKDVA